MTRILLVESGSRYLLEGLISGIRESYGERIFVDLVTCYPGLPAGFQPETTRVYRVTDYRENRSRLVDDLKTNRYSILGMICSAEPIMTKWKWLLAARLPVKVFVLNENGDYFWLDWGHWASIRHFVLYRAGLAGAGAVHTLARLILFPFTLLYLLLYAATVHFARFARRTIR
ncbi:MAG: hypothetical protein HYR60_21330 [Acidobacteria bacterium]|nr:hypothetical protein [Acidobacteriota bacterium]MBI3472567.1 hypothetical protein [Candidatus Solibacter usitatus]